MDDDIVTRLRKCQNEYSSNQIRWEAAEQIERLRKELDIYQTLYAEELERNELPR